MISLGTSSPTPQAWDISRGSRSITVAVIDDGGAEAMQLRIAEQYIGEFGNLAKTGNTYVVPANLGDLTSMMALATDIAKRKIGGDSPSPPSSA